MTEPRMTLPTLLVLQVLVCDPDDELFGRQICDDTGLATGTVHPILARLEGCGWLQCRWEMLNPSLAGRAARRYYALTTRGRRRAHELLSRAITRRPEFRTALEGNQHSPDPSPRSEQPLAAFYEPPTVSVKDDLPLYLAREFDAELRDAVGAGGLVVLHGRTGSGKTRSAVEAIKSWPKRTVLIPRTPTALRELAESQDSLSDAIIWIDDLGSTTPCELDPVVVSRLCPFDRCNVTILVTIRTREWERLTISNPSSPIPSSADSEALSSARWTVAVPSKMFVRDATCRVATQDPRVWRAMYYAPDCHIAYLAGGAQAWRRWKHADELTGVPAIGRAVISAAVELQQTGLTTVSSALIKRLASERLPDDAADRLTPGLFRAALEWATEPLPDSDTGCMAGDENIAYSVHGYILDNAAPLPSDTAVWELAVEHGPAQDLTRVAEMALRNNKTDYAVKAFHQAAVAGDPHAMSSLGSLLEESGQIEQAERFYRASAMKYQCRSGATRLGTLRQRQGRTDEALAWWKIAADAGDLTAKIELAKVLHARGHGTLAIQLWEEAAEAGSTSAMRHLGDVFATLNQAREARRWWRRLGATDEDSTAMLELAHIFETDDKRDYSELWWRKAAKAGDTTAKLKVAGIPASAAITVSTADCRP